MLQPTVATLLALVNDIISQSQDATLKGVVSKPWLLLFDAPIVNPSPQTKLADLQEASFPGYVRKQITTWTGPFHQGDDTGVAMSDVKEWQMSDNTTPTDIYGVGLVSNDVGGTLLAFEQFDTPVSLQTTDDVVAWMARVSIKPQAGIGEGLITVPNP